MRREETRFNPSTDQQHTSSPVVPSRSGTWTELIRLSDPLKSLLGPRLAFQAER